MERDYRERNLAKSGNDENKLKKKKKRMFNHQGKNKQRRFGLSFFKVTKFNEKGFWQKIAGKTKKAYA